MVSRKFRACNYEPAAMFLQVIMPASNSANEAMPSAIQHDPELAASGKRALSEA
jgi:hypothetical protein